MSTIIRLKGVNFNDPTLPVVDTTKHAAQMGLVGEWDMVTFKDSLTMTDLSGSGHDAIFNVAPNIASGSYATFAGTARADTGIMLASNLSGFAVVRMTNIANYSAGFIMSNWANYKGSILWPLGAPAATTPDPWNWGWQQEGNKSEADVVADDTWALLYFYVGTNGASNVKNITTGVTGATPVASGALGTYSWIIGGGRAADTTGAFNDDFNFKDGDIAYCGLYNKVLTAAEEAYLADYLRQKMSLRAITV